MLPSEVLKPGMVGVNLKGQFDVLGTINTFAQGDTKAAHVWWVLPNGKIATTGAKALLFYGEVDPDEYLKGKTCYLLETVDPLTKWQLGIMQACHQDLMKAGAGRFYGIWKPFYIGMLGLFFGGVEKMGFKPTSKRPTFPICSQAVAYPFWKADVPIGKAQGKQDWSAVLPETILKEAQETGFDLSRGWLDNRSTPCYKLRILKDAPYQF